MSEIKITHTHADGTLIEGSRKGDGVWEILLDLRRNGQGNWRSFRSLGVLGLGQSRDKAAQTWKIDKAAEALRAAGHEVETEIDDTQRRSFAEAEAERYERAQDRAAYHEDRAGAAGAEAAARWNAERSILDMIPMGQPILVGHHSEGRHRRDLARADSHARHGLEAIHRQEHHENRAQAAEHFQASREDIPTTLRRIDKLEADERRILRGINGERPANDWRTQGYTNDLAPATGGHLERLQAELADVREQLTYWRDRVKAAQESGVKVWGPDDFTKGDYMNCGGKRWYLVERVNKRTLSVPSGTNLAQLIVVTRANVVHAMGPSDWVEKLPYDKVRGRKSAEEMAEIFAEVERRKAAQSA